MDHRPALHRQPRRLSGEGGFATLSHVAAAGLALYVFALLANLVVVQYAAGVVRAAVDEGARQGAVLGGDAAACERRAGEVLADLLGGPYGDGVAVECVGDPAWMEARAAGTLPPLVPPLPAVSVAVTGGAAGEEQ